MTPNEAIKALEDLLSYVKRHEVSNDDDDKAIEMAISAIRKNHCIDQPH